MLTAKPEQLQKLSEAALTMGPAMGRSAIEAAEAIESLAKNGMSAADILNGGLKSALTLATVGQTDLGAASDATTDILQQFHLATGDLPNVVNKVSGALDASKLSFNGYKDAIGMVGGIAGGLGYSFEDMNTALAAVIPLMTGGSDAGTSFKTFLLSLVPSSKEASAEMDRLGIKFFDAEGNVRSLSEVAEILNTRLSGLNQQARQEALTKMFGTDGMRVALALMQAGAKGIADVKTQIDGVTADQKMAVLLDGEAAATNRLGGLVATNNGTFTTLDLEFDQTRIFRSDGTLLFRVGSTAAGEDPNAVYMPNVVINRLKAGTVESQHIQKGAASASRFAVLTQDASVARVATYQNIATVSFKKEEAGSYILVRTSLNCRSQDDLQFIVAMSVSLEGGGTYTVSSETNMVFDNTNSLARMPISPFALFSDPAVLAHIGYVAINISIRNTEVDNIPLIIAAGSLVEFVEVKGAMLGA